MQHNLPTVHVILRYSWSSGQVEGSMNQLKMLNWRAQLRLLVRCVMLAA
jgi:hypothetical protein